MTAIKNIIWLTIFCFSLTAQASVFRDWLPSRGPSFELIQAEGSFESASDVYIVAETAKTILIFINGESLRFQLGEAKYTRCGTIEYIAIHQELDLEEETLSLVVQDHSTRICKDAKRYQWEAKLQHINYTTDDFGALHFVSGHRSQLRF